MSKRYSAVLATLLLASTSACAQGTNRRSQLGVVTQWIAGTKVEITYRRPVARGRALFGALVPYGRSWTPSADSAARISTSAPIEINGGLLPAGTYSIWAIPDSLSWTITFNRRANLFHLAVPAGDDALQVRATPVRGEHVETLMFVFPMVDGDSARLELRWGTTVVPLRIRAR